MLLMLAAELGSGESAGGRLAEVMDTAVWRVPREGTELLLTWVDDDDDVVEALDCASAWSRAALAPLDMVVREVRLFLCADDAEDEGGSIEPAARAAFDDEDEEDTGIVATEAEGPIRVMPGAEVLLLESATAVARLLLDVRSFDEGVDDGVVMRCSLREDRLFSTSRSLGVSALVYEATRARRSTASISVGVLAAL